MVLVLKSLLKEQGLNDVSTGGLSSFTLANMVLAHLHQEQQAIRTLPYVFKLACPLPS